MREQLRRIYDKTNGSCHLCGKKLAFTNYGEVGARASWEVEHSIPLANGGTHHGNNLFASCVPCNRSKAADVSSQAVRARNGLTRTPLSRERRDDAQARNTLIGIGTVAAAGGFIAGPVGIAIGALVGGLVGNSIDPE